MSGRDVLYDSFNRIMDSHVRESDARLRERLEDKEDLDLMNEAMSDEEALSTYEDVKRRLQTSKRDPRRPYKYEGTWLQKSVGSPFGLMADGTDKFGFPKFKPMNRSTRRNLNRKFATRLERLAAIENKKLSMSKRLRGITPGGTS